MSYCVNCGVKLESSLKTCPLCHTPVFNLREIHSSSATPFASARGEVEPLKKNDVALWLTIVFGSTAITCGILNLFVFQHNYWSIPVIGACIVLWLLFCPRMFFPKIPLVLNLTVSALSIIFYEYAITFMTAENLWFFKLALPITLVSLGLIAISVLLYRYVSGSLISTVLYFFVDVAFLCITVEYFTDLFVYENVTLFWSVIVFSVCAVISVALISILSIARLRETVRKRLHF